MSEEVQVPCFTLAAAVGVPYDKFTSLLISQLAEEGVS